MAFFIFFGQYRQNRVISWLSCSMALWRINRVLSTAVWIFLQWSHAAFAVCSKNLAIFTRHSQVFAYCQRPPSSSKAVTGVAISCGRRSRRRADDNVVTPRWSTTTSSGRRRRADDNVATPADDDDVAARVEWTTSSSSAWSVDRLHGSGSAGPSSSSSSDNGADSIN